MAYPAMKPKIYHLPPTELIPNSPYPLLHYPNMLSLAASADPNSNPASQSHALFARNGWHTQWIFRYGPSQRSHYHSSTHECMAVLSGTATIRFGAADTSESLDESTHGGAKEPGGVEVHAGPGDVFVIPAGVAHKTFDVTEGSEFGLLTPGDGHFVAGEGLGKGVEEVIEGIQLSGFTMLGAYPDGGVWDFAMGGEGGFQRVWEVPRPGKDPVVGEAKEGVCGLWV